MDGNKNIRKYKRRRSNGTTVTIILLSTAVALTITALVLVILGVFDPLFQKDGEIPTPSETAQITDTNGDTAEPTEADQSDEPNEESEPAQTQGENSQPAQTEGKQTETKQTDPTVSSPDEFLPGHNVPAETDESGEWILLGKDSDNYGSVLLVDNNHEYTFPQKNALIDLYTYRQQNGAGKYQLSNSSLKLNEQAAQMLNAMLIAYAQTTGNNHIIVTGAYRDYDTQQSIYEKNGGKNTFKGGCTDYHTGDAVYLKIFTESGAIEEIARDAQAKEWFAENAHKFGFIMRYPQGKTDYTGKITDGEGHYRYVGVEHATAMAENEWCLEEYLLALKDYTYAGEHLTVTTAAGSFEIFSIQLDQSEENQTPVPYPQTMFTMSGDNCGTVIFVVATE